MRLPEFLFSCVMAVLGGGEAPDECKDYALVGEMAAAFSEAAEDHGVPATVIAAVAFHESGLNPRAIGPDGMDIGLMQVRRGGAIPARYARWSDRALQNIRLNVSIGASYLAQMKRSCPRWYLSRYNGRPCKASSYSSAVLALLNRFATKKRDTSRVAKANNGRIGQGPALQTPTAEEQRVPRDGTGLHLRMGMPGLWFFRRQHRSVGVLGSNAAGLA